MLRRAGPATMAILLSLAAGPLAACDRVRAGDDCAGAITPVSPGPAPGNPPTAEALWLADGTGRLRAIDGRTGRVTATVDLGRIDPRIPLPPALIAGGGLLWAYRLDTGAVTLIDPVAAAVTRRAATGPARPAGANRLLFAHGALWIAQPGRLWRITPAGAVTRSALPGDLAPSSFAATGHWLWLAAGGRLLRLDPADPAAVTSAPAATGTSASAAAVTELVSAGGGMYATGVNSPVVRRLDPDTGAEVGSVRLAHGELALSLVAAGAQVWTVGNCGNLVRLADSYPVKISDVSQDLPAVAAQGSLLVADEVRSEVVRLDPDTGRVLARMPFAAADPDDPAFGLVPGRSTAWVLDGDFAAGVSRVDAPADRITRILSGRPGSGSVAAAVAAPPR
jgi:outer membrane protein assembly factor BamB